MKIILNQLNISVEEKPTGEIYASAGAGTSGAHLVLELKKIIF